jgi:hypothetical protein
VQTLLSDAAIDGHGMRREAVSPPPGATGETAADTAAQASTQVATLLLADIADGSRLWGWSRIVRGPGAVRDVPGLRFCKVLGSGHDGGFGLRPSASRQGLFCVFDCDRSAREFLSAGMLVRTYRDRARELLTLRLAPYSVRGAWSGMTPQPSTIAPTQGPIAALTRASIRLRAAAAFWRQTPASQASLAQAPGCLLAVGLGEAPLLRQATFSVWDGVASMDAYARQGAHMAAIRASRAQQFFSESMFVRFLPLSMHGTWKGHVYNLGDDRPAA